jgi:hypothetical protein
VQSIANPYQALGVLSDALLADGLIYGTDRGWIAARLNPALIGLGLAIGTLLLWLLYR